MFLLFFFLSLPFLFCFIWFSIWFIYFILFYLFFSWLLLLFLTSFVVFKMLNVNCAPQLYPISNFPRSHRVTMVAVASSHNLIYRLSISVEGKYRSQCARRLYCSWCVSAYIFWIRLPIPAWTIYIYKYINTFYISFYVYTCIYILCVGWNSVLFSFVLLFIKDLISYHYRSQFVPFYLVLLLFRLEISGLLTRLTRLKNREKEYHKRREKRIVNELSVK